VELHDRRLRVFLPHSFKGVVYVGSADNNTYALNATTGALVWNYTTGSFVVSSPAVSNGVVYVGSFDHNVYAIGNAAAATSQGAPGFEVAFAVVGLAVTAYVVSRRR
jgi:PGF-CTERM protein